MLNFDHLSDAMYHEIQVRNAVDVGVFTDDLKIINVQEFLVYNFKRYSPLYLDRLMFASKQYWSSFTLSNWIEVISLAANNEFSLNYCIIFLYKYIQIDSLRLVNEIPNLDSEVKITTLKYFEKSKGLLAFVDRIDMDGLNRFGLTLSTFTTIKERLITEGAKVAIPVEYQIVRLA